MTSPRLPALLCDATFHGTLAAVRSLGRGGIPVFVADPGRMTPAAWSRYATRTLRSPRVSHAARFMEWLVRLGQREGRLVVCPTSDEMALLLSTHRDALANHFALYQPDEGTLMRVLDKKRLLEAAAMAGIDAPETFFPETAAEVARIAREAEGPLLLKPRTQLFLEAHGKGSLVPAAAKLDEAFDAYRRDHRYMPPISDRHPELTSPMLQRYHPEAAFGIYSLSGFRSRSGEVLRMLGATKVLQRPRRLGIGLCFESAPVPDDMQARARRLLDELGYFGVFELEFIHVEGRHLLIDMNPRFFNQMQLDVSRGLDLPRLAYAAALGDQDEVAAIAARPPPDPPIEAFCNGIGLRILVGAQRTFGTMSRAEAARWRAWRREHGRGLVDSIAAPDDPGPVVAEGAGQLYSCLRHPRAFLRMIALDR
jgi:predicted ATP-grasp superfamily ATP-dependent carboligase